MSSFLLILLPGLLPAQIFIEGQIRPRTELRHGYGRPASPSSQAAIFTSQRSRLRFIYSEEKFRMGLTLQDVRVWGDEAQLEDVPSAALHEAWGEVRLSNWLRFKFGRQELVYDDHRLLGNVDWTQQARSHDAALLKLQSGRWKLDLGAAYNNEAEQVFRERYRLNNYRSLFFLWANRRLGGIAHLSIYAIADGFEPADSALTRLQYRFTVGPYVQVASGPFHFLGNFFYQTGKDPFQRSIDAYLLVLQAHLKGSAYSIGGGMDYLSGTDGLGGKSNRYRTFNTLYATNHKFYGTMDYFLNIPVHTANGGLVDFYLKAEFAPTKRQSLSLDYHHFRLANRVENPQQPGRSLSKSLGSELDAAFHASIFPEVSLQGGYSIMFPTGSMGVLKGGDKDTFQYWGWLMVNLRFKVSVRAGQTPGG